MDYRIKEGTKVNIHFVRSTSIFGGTLLHRPRGEGDSFVINDNGNIVEIVMFETMEVTK